MARFISFDELLGQLEKLKNVDATINIEDRNKRELQRKRSTAYGGSSWRGRGPR